MSLSQKEKNYIRNNINKKSIGAIANDLKIKKRKIVRFLQNEKNSSSYADAGNSQKQGRPDAAYKLQWYYGILIYSLIFFIAFAVLTPIIISNQWHQSHEYIRYLQLFDEVKDAFLKGVLYPRWLPDACGGYGYPTFLFYQPGFFFIALPFSFLPNYPLSTMYATLVLLFFAGGVGVYKLCREIAGVFVGLFCAILYLLTPYLYVNLYVRGDLSELMAMLLCPWAVYFLIILKKRLEKNSFQAGAMLGIAVSFFLIIISHPAVAMFFCMTFGFLAVYLSLDLGLKKRKFLLNILLSASLGIILSSPYWVTVFQMRRYVNLEPALSGFYIAKNHVVYLPQFFSRFWGFGGSIPGAVGEGMSFQLGLPHFLLAIIGVVWSRKDKLIQGAVILYLLLILLMTNFSSLLWEKINLLRYVQFPWRILSVTALLQIICISGVKNIVTVGKQKWIKKAALLFILIISLAWYSNEFQVNNYPVDARRALESHRQTKLQGFYTYTCENEFMPKTASLQDIEPRRDAPLLLLDPPGEMKELKGNSPYRIRYQIFNKVPTIVTINQFYMPGWRIIIDGKDIPPTELKDHLTKNGLMQFPLSSEKSHYIEAFYGGPPGSFMRNIMILLALLAFVAFYYHSYRSHKIYAKQNK